MKDRGTIQRVILAAGALSMALLAPQAASAHTSPQNHNGFIYAIPGFCVSAGVEQDHSYHVISTSDTNCSGLPRQNWHRQYQQYFKGLGGAGEYCFSVGPYESSGETVYRNVYYWDIWNWCNYGTNVNVRVFIDSWQAAWDPTYYGIGWREGAWRPATSHCHCP